MTLKAVPPGRRGRGRRPRLSNEYLRYIRSPLWRTRSREYRRAHPICEVRWCSNRATQVHHLTYARLGRELPEDLMAVCTTCHKKIHGR